MCEEKDVSKIYYKLLEIPGIKDKSAARIINGIKDNLKLIEYLEDKLTILNEDTESAKYSVCFTKVRDEELEKYILLYSSDEDYTKCGKEYLSNNIFLGYYDEVGTSSDERPYYSAYCSLAQRWRSPHRRIRKYVRCSVNRRR